MRFAIVSTLALLPVLAQAAPAGSQTLAAVSQPKLVRASATTAPAAAAEPAAVAVAPVGLHDVIHTKLNSDLRDQRVAGELTYTFYGDSQADDRRVQSPQLIHAVGRTLPVSQIEDAEKTDVAVRVIVDATGAPLFSSITRSAGAPVDTATLAAVKNYRFTPAKVDGVPVAADVTLTLHLEKN
jgi:TonB family protein